MSFLLEDQLGDDLRIDIETSIAPNSSNEIMSLEDIKTPESDEESAMKRPTELMVEFIKDKFERSKEVRSADEARWMQAWRNYRGEYGPDNRFTDSEKSRAFVKITKTKVNAAYAKITEVLFSGQKFPIGVEPTPKVEGVAEAVYFDPKEQQDEDPNAPSKSPRSTLATRPELLELLGPYKEQLERVQDKLREGYGNTPTSVTFEPAVMAAKNAERRIHDQLEESDASTHLRSVAFEMTLFGTGCMKGPLVKEKEYPKWTEDGKYAPVKRITSDVSYVPIWNVYPDADARTMNDCESFIERHRLSRTALRALKQRPYFRKEVIEKVIAHGPNYVNEGWEQEITSRDNTRPDDRWEVLEYWGVIDKHIAEIAEMPIPEEYEDKDQVQVNIWVCGDDIIRMVINPFNPSRINYYLVPYEINPYSIFGIGVAENMQDTQLLMNGFIRLAVDNAALSSNVVFEVDEGALTPGQSLDIYPGKVFKRSQGAPGQAIFSTTFQNVTQECLAMFDKARQIADEATGIPSYSHGDTSVGGVGRTASGMSMLMGAAAENIKAVIRNVDDYLLAPLGKSMYAFNMQFVFDKNEVGDLEVIARGTESLMRNEVRSQKILQFLQITSNPMDAAFVKRDYLLRELASSLDIDPDKAVNDPREASIQATVMAETAAAMGAALPGGQPQQGQPNAGGAAEGDNPAGAPAPTDPTQTGGGNIAPGAAPTPGEEGFTGN